MERCPVEAVDVRTSDLFAVTDSLTRTEDGAVRLSTLVTAPPVAIWDRGDANAVNVVPCAEVAVGVGAAQHWHVRPLCTTHATNTSQPET